MAVAPPDCRMRGSCEPELRPLADMKWLYMWLRPHASVALMRQSSTPHAGSGQCLAAVSFLLRRGVLVRALDVLDELKAACRRACCRWRS